MTKAKSSLTDAGAALSDAVVLQQSLQGSSLAAEPQPPTQKAGESHQDFALRQQDSSKAHTAYAAEYDRREAQSAHKTGEVDKNYTAAVEVMEQINGNPDRPRTSGSGGGGGSTTGGMPGSTGGGLPGSTGGRLPTGGGTHHGGDLASTTVGNPPAPTHHHQQLHPHTDEGYPPGYLPPTDGSGGPPVYGNPGESQGAGYPGSTGPVSGSTGTPGTSGSLPGSSVAVGGVLGGGRLGGASGLSAALRGATAASPRARRLVVAAPAAGRRMRRRSRWPWQQVGQVGQAARGGLLRGQRRLVRRGRSGTWSAGLIRLGSGVRAAAYVMTTGN